MHTLVIITFVLVLIYLFYPIWLVILKNKVANEITNRDLRYISVIYLSQNGEKMLFEKISFILNEISEFIDNEFIIIDDNSNDSSMKILNQFEGKNIKILHNTETKGIPYSMNLGVKISKFDNIVFCDQRQNLSKGIFKKLIEPLKYDNVGVVSACISNFDKNNRFSIIRAHENFLKQKESKIGSLIGVYGPLYAVKKQCFAPIPEKVILDDLFLSLTVLSKYQVLFEKECQIIDDGLDKLYNYNRTKRYLKGFIQLFSLKIFSNLSTKQVIMFFWHKFLRIIIALIIFFVLFFF